METNGTEATLPDGWEFKHVVNALLRHSGLDETSAQAWIASLSPVPGGETGDADESETESD